MNAILLERQGPYASIRIAGNLLCYGQRNSWAGAGNSCEVKATVGHPKCFDCRVGERREAGAARKILPTFLRGIR